MKASDFKKLPEDKRKELVDKVEKSTHWLAPFVLLKLLIWETTSMDEILKHESSNIV